WRTRFLRHGPAGLRDRPRAGRPPGVSHAQVLSLVLGSLLGSLTPRGRSTLRQLAKRCGLSVSTAHRVLKGFPRLDGSVSRKRGVGLSSNLTSIRLAGVLLK